MRRRGVIAFILPLIFSWAEAAQAPRTLRVGVIKEDLLVIRNLALDDYVKGVLPNEVSPQWPMEALKAQAVATRTYALSNLDRHGADGYDICATVHCQVFGGKAIERERTNRAAEETHNEVLLYKGSPAGAYFFSNCGGRTRSPVDVWEGSESIPYLKSVRCKFCKSGPHYSWEREVSGGDILAALLRAGFKAPPPVKSIRVSDGDVLVRHGAGQVKVRVAKFRAMMGANVIRSDRIEKVRKDGGGFVFSGKGWGHGVGMCQEGAKGMAEKGAGYAKILKFYYSGTQLQKF